MAKGANVSLGVLVGLGMLSSCANQGSGPDGGPYDETPPRVVSMTPPTRAAQGTKHGTHISIKFSEPVQLDNAMEKVIVSPPQIEQPEISASGRHVNVQLLDTLRRNTTYTIDFGDAITDATEKNPLGLFTYIFSTGATTDTMEISGHVLSAETLEPLKGVLVGLYPADSPDSILRTEAMHRVARSNAEGFFSIKGVGNKPYRAVCLEDKDQDFRFSMKNELIGWLRDAVTPGSYPDVRYDTTWVDTTRWSRIDTVAYTHFTPDNLVLLGFTEANQPRHRLKHNRDNPNRLQLYFTAPSKHRPEVQGVNFDASKLLLEHSAGYDTLCYWITDTTLVNTDSLQLTLTYENSDDSTGVRSLCTDTIDFVPRMSFERRQKQLADEHAKWLKGLERRHKRGDHSQETPPVQNLGMDIRTKGSISPMDVVNISFDEPIDTLPPSAIHLLLGPDSTAVNAPFELERSPQNIRTFRLRAEWRPGQRYRLLIDSAAIRSIYGKCNTPEEARFGVANMEDYGTIFIRVPGADTTCVVQLLDGGNKVVRQERLDKGIASFYYLSPNSYYYRCFIDSNGDGRWTPGELDSGTLAEEVYYCPTRIDVKANFDFDQTWDLHALPLTHQRPAFKPNDKSKRRANTSSAHEKNLQRKK